MKKIDTLVFDLDGTLLDTLTDLKNSLNTALEKFGMPPRTLEEVRHFVGNGNAVLIRRAVPRGEDGEAVEKVYEAFKTIYEEHMRDNTRPYDGVIELLQKLKASGYKTAVVSNKNDEFTKALCAETFGGLIDFARGVITDKDRKPSPDSVFSCLGYLGSDRDSAVYVGDSETDYMTAVNAGLPCISVLWGFRTKEELLACGADNFARTPEEVWEKVTVGRDQG